MATSTLPTTHLSRSPPPSARHHNYPFPATIPSPPSSSTSKVGRDRVRTAYKSDRSAPNPPYARSRSRAQDQQPKEEEKIQQVFFPPFESLSSSTTTPNPSTSTAESPYSRADGSQANDVDPEVDPSTQAWAALLSSSITSAAGKSSTLGIGEVEDHRYLGGKSSSGTQGKELIHQQGQGYSHSRGSSASIRNRQRGTSRDRIGSNDRDVYREREQGAPRVTSPSPIPLPQQIGKRILDTMEIGVRTTIEPKLKMIKGHMRSRSTVEGGSGGIYNAIGLSIDSNSVESMMSSGILLPRPEAIESFFTCNASTSRTPQHIPTPSSSTSSRAQSVPPSSSQSEPISPLTRRARKVLGEVDLDMMNTPLEECRGGAGKVEAIRLDDIRAKSVGAGILEPELLMGKTGLVRPPTPKLQRSHTLPTRPKRKAVSADLTHPTNRRYIVITPAETPSEPCTPRKPRARPPPLRDLPPPSWSCPGPSPPLTSLAPPFSTDLFVLPYPNPIATVMYSLNDTPPISPENREAVVRSAPAEVVSDPIEELYEPKSKRTRRRGSSLSSFESTTETIRPWHLLSDITPKASRAQLREQVQEGQVGTAAAAMHTELQLESLVCDWDFDAEDERGRLGKKVRKPSHMDRERMREDIRTLRRKSEGKRAKYANRG